MKQGISRYRIAGASFVLLFLVAGLYLLQKDLGTMISQQRKILEQAAKTAALWIPAPSQQENADIKNSQSLRDSQLSDALFKAELDLLVTADIDLIDLNSNPLSIAATSHPKHSVGSVLNLDPELQMAIKSQMLGSSSLQWKAGEWRISSFAPVASDSRYAVVLHSPQGAFFWSLCRYVLHYLLLGLGFLFLGSFFLAPALKTQAESIADEELLSAQQHLLQENETLQQQVMTDSLTQLFNRAYFQHFTSPSNLKWIAAEGCSMLVIDLDNFKNVNDTFGHAQGDKMLVEFSQFLKKFFRKSDKVIRYGGDEFVVLLTGTKITEALRISQNLIELLRKQVFSGGHMMTASIGVSELSPGETAHDWFERGDAALYNVKHSGKNSVRVFETQPLEILN